MLTRRRIWKSSWHPFLLTFAALALSALSLKALPMPFVWIGLTWALALFGGIVYLRRPWPRALLFLFLNASITAVMFTATEAYLSVLEIEAPSYSDGYRVRDDVLGTAPVRGVQAHSTKTERGVRLYDVTYTIDVKGLRAAPPVKNGESPSCILFFGCSFTFGEGLQDTETLPFQVGIHSGGQYRTFNFGFHGYGPHQMLAAIEHGLVRRVVDCRPEYAIYQALPHHVVRVAGKVFFGQHAPRYKIGSDGIVRLTGHFDDGKKVSSPLEKEVRWHLGKSTIYRFLERFLENQNEHVSRDDIRLLLAIVRRSKDLISAEYPGIKFHVILWQNWQEEAVIYRELQDGFRQMNIPIHLVEDILPGYTVDSPKYVLSTIDKHPNVLANRILAQYVLSKIVSSEQRHATRTKLGS